MVTTLLLFSEKIIKGWDVGSAPSALITFNPLTNPTNVDRNAVVFVGTPSESTVTVTSINDWSKLSVILILFVKILNIYQKILIFFVGFGTIFLVITGMYLNSPVGGKMTFGLQGRYFIPAVPIILLLLYNNQFENKKWNKWKFIVVGLYIIIYLTYTLIYLDDTFYAP